MLYRDLPARVSCLETFECNVKMKGYLSWLLASGGIDVFGYVCSSTELRLGKSPVTLLLLTVLQ